MFFVYHLSSQVLPSNRAVNWKLAGMQIDIPDSFPIIDLQNYGIHSNGILPNDDIIDSIIDAVQNQGAVLMFPQGEFLFNEAINLKSKIILKGSGVEYTTLIFDENGSGNSINIHGSSTTDTTYFAELGQRDSSFIIVNSPTNFSSGDWIKITQNDLDLITSAWAFETVGQVVQISSISGNKVFLNSPLRLNYSLTRTPYIRKINPIEKCGIECLKIQRQDNSNTSQTSNIDFAYAINSWVKNIESENCNYSHIKATACSNLMIRESYFHHAFDYGEGGRGYGVMLCATTNECLVENNVFNHLRHSMILQAGANCNVFTYNYSADAFWTSHPSDASGDIVLHGNYVYANLFEQNICQNIVIDDSHGPNGPFNTFFRNRGEKCGIFFSAANSPSQNIIGNEIPNTTFPYSLVNYNIQGADHFLYANNNKGVIAPEEIGILIDSSYYFQSRPAFVDKNSFGKIGPPNIMGTATIPAKTRFNGGNLIYYTCDYSLGIEEYVPKTNNSKEYKVYPNPSTDFIWIESPNYQEIKSVSIISLSGSKIFTISQSQLKTEINLSDFTKGIYLLEIEFENTVYYEKIIVE